MGKATVRISLKTIAMNFPSGSMERAYLHGMWQKERKRQPCLLFGNHSDPREAFAAATQLVGEYIERVRKIPFSRYHDWHSWVDDIQARIDPSELF